MERVDGIELGFFRRQQRMRQEDECPVAGHRCAAMRTGDRARSIPPSRLMLNRLTWNGRLQSKLGQRRKSMVRPVCRK
ncbi:hypothetical protein [Noviherbaspirillum humi]|uniref:hypothetical protein n=1 Tax=Noviherbaspirillum humi TaxID=1688639 RepID=UPI001FED2106|nr:hypothetical protein [Noviherbaspirillum humi]